VSLELIDVDWFKVVLRWQFAFVHDAEEKLNCAGGPKDVVERGIRGSVLCDAPVVNVIHKNGS
jgi:hypothetical protein